MKKLTLIILIFTLFITAGMASEDKHTNLKNDTLNPDNPVAAMMDSLLVSKYYKYSNFTADTAKLNIYNFPPDSVPKYSDSIYFERISKLNAQTPIELHYNRYVKSFINLYAVRKRELTSRILGLAEFYFPLFEEQLDKHDLPLELKYLAVIESALNPVAGSRAGAKGLWQFMYGTGKIYNLKVTSYIDERYDPRESTIAACQHLKDLYDVYGDWMLVLAAYNSGGGNVNKAIRRSGGSTDFWDIMYYLPRETRGYVPAFIAVNYVMNHAAEHNLYPVDPGFRHYETDTVKVNEVLSFEQISEKLGVSMDTLDYLNPVYRKNIIPSTDDKKYSLRLPKPYIASFINNEKELYQYKTRKGIERDKLLAEMKRAKQRITHRVRWGESLSVIAERYHTSVRGIRHWNNLRGSRIYKGQRLTIYPNGNYRESSSSVSKEGKSIHYVRRGENLGLIARKYNCTINELMRWNDLNGYTIHPNQKLIVRGKESVKQVEIPENAKIEYYEVKPGDTLWDIAKQYKGLTIDQIKLLNNISNARQLKPGQKIKVAIGG
ncbi:MAG: LysM peptidoglycan-binding domain-containing protein [Bacteroidales bacterium]|nr:LysM peptidoglycan-binding domain-containing protein [Bacteroidales bacterium]